MSKVVKTKSIEIAFRNRKIIKKETINEKENKYRFYFYENDVKYVFYNEAQTYIITHYKLFPLIF